MARQRAEAGRGWVAAVLVAAACGIGSGVRAQQPEDAGTTPATEASKPLADLVSDLSSPDFHTRELATVRIRDDKSIRLADIERILTERELPLEAHSRLLTIARERFSTSPRAAMGVQFDLTTLRDRIVIDNTFEPFDCHRVLEPGDIIIEADGIPLQSGAARPLIQGLIISRDPGDTMKLVVRRGREKLNLEVKLGDFRELRNNSLDELRLYRAWKTRSLAYSRQAAPVKTPVHVDAWPDAMEASRQLPLQQMRAQSHSPNMAVHAGGRARTSNIVNDSSWYSIQQLRAQNGGRINGLGVNPQALQMMLEFDDPSPQPPMTFAEESERLAQKRTALEGQLDRARREAERSAPGSPESALLESRVARVELDIRAVDRQLEAITAERDEIAAEAAKKRSSAANAEQDG